MNEYIVSARKYRPQAFSQVVGQEHITKTLENSILNNTVAHAYLFCGPRGVGKTTCARIFAKLVNPESDTEYNIFELDAASNNGVDHIRNLIEKVKIPPQIGQYKVYIIDEVHMLSDAAFNAFLKTLEEPPKHSIFILATTEKNKLIPTILSRCQIFNFQKINISNIISHLSKIASKNEIQVEQKTLQLLAHNADGSLRDALSIFDKIHTYCNKKWPHEEVLKILLTLDSTFSINLTNYIINNDLSKCLLMINSIFNKGISPKEIIKNIISHYRNLMVAKDPSTISIIEEPENILAQINEQSKFYSKENLLCALNCLNETDQNYSKSINKQFLIELCIMQLCSLNDDHIKKKIRILKPTTPSNQNLNTEKKKEAKQEERQIIIENKTQILEPATADGQNLKNEKNTEVKKDEMQMISNDPSKLDLKQPNNSTSELISISEELEPKKTKEFTTNTTVSESTWSEEKMTQLWNSFAKKLEKSKKLSAYNIFSRYLPIKENNNIVVDVFSMSEKSEIENTKLALLNEMKVQLKNNNIKLIVNISNQEKNDTFYTNKEKYNFLLEQNQQITLLQKKLDLTII